jgi:hypothetical protein
MSAKLYPQVFRDPEARACVERCVERLARLCDGREIEAFRAEALKQADSYSGAEENALHLRIVLSLLCDLRAQRWCVRLDHDGLAALPQRRDHFDAASHKAEVRAGHLVDRDAQLALPATRRFIASMEQPRLFGGGWQSIFSLMRDGRPLARQLLEVRSIPDGEERRRALRSIIDPYVQVVERTRNCQFTSLPLSDIWRYFRHSWSTAYRSVPGRQLSFLIRDRATPNHPVVGIGALSSAVVQQSNRDRWIGWHKQRFFEILAEDGYQGWPSWIQTSLESLLGGIYIADFLQEGILSKENLSSPNLELIQSLRVVAEAARKAHRLYPEAERHKAVTSGRSADWEQQARTQLFRAKRSVTLAKLLEARLQLRQSGFTKATPRRLREALASAAGRRAVGTILRQVKATHVGIDMMDIAVCGAIAPYGPLLGGKLVSMLMASPEVVLAYQERYQDAVSIIASSMAGREVKRSPRLVLLGTTSLYGVASSQYNRVRVPAEAAGGKAGERLEYVSLEQTEGWGSYHISKHTLEAMEILLARAQRGREVNSIFGEGVNPRMRKIRSALEALGLPSDLLLNHRSPRIVYAVALATNFRDVLLGRTDRPEYIVPLTTQATDAVVDYWRERWLSRRIESDAVLSHVQQNTLVHPIRHGGRVLIPHRGEEELGPLFD